MKIFAAISTFIFSLSISAQDICPVGFEKAKSNDEISKLSGNHLLVMNNADAIKGDGTFEGTTTFTNNGLFRMNYKQKLPKGVEIEPYTHIKIVGAAKWDMETCGLLTSHCLLVDHPQIKSVQIDSKRDKKVRDLRIAGIEVCKESSGSSLAKKNVVDIDRSIAGGKIIREPDYQSGPLHESSSAQ